MLDFIYNTPTKVVFGRDAENGVGALVAQTGAHKVLVHFGGHSAIDSGLLQRVIDSLDGAGIPHVELGGVVPNPHMDKVYEGLTLCRSEGVDFILAVGGGSVIDSSKAIGYGLANDCDPWDVYDRRIEPTSCTPIGAVLTIAAAGSEMSNSSVLTNEREHRKRGYKNECCRCAFAVLDPKLTMTLPAYQTASGCVDILMHTMERYFTLVDTMELTDVLSEALMRDVIKYAQVLRDDPRDYDARAEIMWASSLSHNNLMQCGNDGGDWASHQIEHELSGMFFDIAHGAGLASIWGSWARYVMDAAPERFARFAREVWGVGSCDDTLSAGLEGIEATEEFYRSIGMPTSLHELGLELDDAQIEHLADSCCFMGRRTVGVVKRLDSSDVARIYRMAL